MRGIVFLKGNLHADLPVVHVQPPKKGDMFHSSNPTLFGRPRGVLSESEAIWRTIAGLRRVSEALHAPAFKGVIEARRLLANLSANLSTYFDPKEARGYFGTIVAECPGLAERVTAVGKARAVFQHSVTSVRRLAFRTADNAELGRRIDRVVDGFETQEHLETALLQSFFLGVTDGAETPGAAF